MSNKCLSYRPNSRRKIKLGRQFLYIPPRKKEKKTHTHCDNEFLSQLNEG